MRNQLKENKSKMSHISFYNDIPFGNKETKEVDNEKAYDCFKSTKGEDETPT